MFKSKGTEGGRKRHWDGQIIYCWSRACADKVGLGIGWMSVEAGIGSGSQLDGGEWSWRRVGMSNLRLGQCLAWWLGCLPTMQMCRLLQSSLLPLSYLDQSAQIW